ncbi:hypothetical protein ACF0H5_003405 [Mactra antiquata]
MAGFDTSQRNVGEFMSALKDRDRDKALKLLSGDNFDPNSFYVDEETGIACVLFQAIRTNQPDIVEILLQKGADPNFKDEEGDTPLFAALDHELDERIPTLLLDNGADVNIRNNAGNTAFMQAAMRGMDFGHLCIDSTLFDILSKCNDFMQCNSRDQFLIHMIPFVHSVVVTMDGTDHVCLKFLRLLTEKGTNVNARDGTGLTPLHYACFACCHDAVTFLIENGSNVTSKSLSGQTVLHALGNNPSGPDFPRIIEYLTKRGLDINEKDMYGRNVLHYTACSNNVNKAAIEVILANGGHSSTKDKFGLTPLHLCVIPSVFIAKDHVEDDEDQKNDVSEVISLLVQNGADINAGDKSQLTPLHHALRYEDKVLTVKALLENNADISRRTKTGESALHRATLYPKLLESVLDHIKAAELTVDVNQRDHFGSTPLHWAIYYMSAECIKMLRALDADLTIPNSIGLNPCEYAIFEKRTEMFENLDIVYCRHTYPLPYTITDEDRMAEFEGNKKVIDVITHKAMTKEQSEWTQAETNQKNTDNEESIDTEDVTDDTTQKKCVHKEHSVESKTDNNNSRQTHAKLLEEQCSGSMEHEHEDNDSKEKLVDMETASDEDSCESKEFDEQTKDDDMLEQVDILSDDSNNSEYIMALELERLEECTKIDHMWCDCPLLSEIENCDGCICLASWSSHLLCHRRSLAAYMNLVLESKQMGLYSVTEENGTVANCIKHVLKTLGEEVKRIKPLLEFDLKLAGSWNEGTKIAQPEEFDYKLILRNFSTTVQTFDAEDSNLRGFVQFRLKDGQNSQAFKEFVDADGFLDGRKVVRALYSAINTALVNIPVDTLGQLYITKYLRIEKGSIDHLSFRWVGLLYKNLLIDVDIVPTIVPEQWNSIFINRDKKLYKLRGSSSVVLKTPDSRFVNGWYTYFRLSVADFESEIFHSLPREVLKGYILVKSLIETLHYPQIRMTDNEDYLRQRCLTTYMLKSCFLHQVEESWPYIKDTDLLTKKREAAAVSKSDEVSKKLVAIKMAGNILDFLEQSIEANHLDSFFIPKVNLLVNDSLTRFNDKFIFDTEVMCLKTLLKVGTNEMKEQGYL